jgi:hypothetical protein
MTTSTPALISVLYSLTNESQATLALHGHCEPWQRITVTHESQEIKRHTMAGNETLLSLPVTTGEIITILVRQAGTMIGCGTFEVQLDLSEVYGVILVPKTCSDLILDQCDAGIVERGNQRSLQVFFKTPELAQVR